MGLTGCEIANLRITDALMNDGVLPGLRNRLWREGSFGPNAVRHLKHCVVIPRHEGNDDIVFREMAVLSDAQGCAFIDEIDLDGIHRFDLGEPAVQCAVQDSVQRLDVDMVARLVDRLGTAPHHHAS